MITIEYDFDNLEMSVKGHAHGGVVDEDIYCAGVSVLTIALACTLKEANRQGMIKTLDLKVDDGDAHFKVIPKKGYKANIQTMFTTIMNGYDAMSVSFPDKVSFKPMG